MTKVVECNDGIFHEVVVDLQHSTIEHAYNSRATFCYYKEMDALTTFAGLKFPLIPHLKIFVKLSDSEPVDLAIQELLEILSLFPEFIPDEI